MGGNTRRRQGSDFVCLLKMETRGSQLIIGCLLVCQLCLFLNWWDRLVCYGIFLVVFSLVSCLFFHHELPVFFINISFSDHHHQ